MSSSDQINAQDAGARQLGKNDYKYIANDTWGQQSAAGINWMSQMENFLKEIKPKIKEGQAPKASETVGMIQFDHSKPMVVEKFIADMNRSIKQYGWSEEGAAETAKKLLDEKAGIWIDRLERMNMFGTSTWTHLEILLRRRYGKKTSVSAMAEATRKLQQGDKEPTIDFFERILDAIWIQDMSLPTNIKNLDVYEKIFMHRVYVFLAAGLSRKLQMKTINMPDPPKDANELLKQCEHIETQEGVSGSVPKPGEIPATRVASVEEVDETYSVQENRDDKGHKQEIAELRAMIESINAKVDNKKKSGKKSGTVPAHIKCYNCGENHFIRDCKKPKQKRPAFEEADADEVHFIREDLN